MKFISFFAVLTAIFTLSAPKASAQIADTSLIVNGVCSMCKRTIENAADIPGVKKAVWSSESKILVLRLDTTKTSLSEVNKAVLKSGYDTEYATATEEDYQTLHDCCHYRDPAVLKEHEDKQR